MVMTCAVPATCQNTSGLVKSLLRQLDGRLDLEVSKYQNVNLIEQRRFLKDKLQLENADWQLSVDDKPVTAHPEARDVTATFVLKSGESASTAVSAAFTFNNWKAENYVMVPASIYNGNRYTAIGNGYNPDYPKEMYYDPAVPLTISNNPRLSVEKGQRSVIELQTGNAATPAMCFFSRSKKKGFIVLTDQGSKYGNNGMTIIENAAQDTCTFKISAPAVRKRAAGFGDFHNSGDHAPDWKAGDKLTVNFRIYVFSASNIPDLLTKFMQVRKEFTGPNHPRDQLPMSKYMELATTICSNNFINVPTGSYYMPENNKDFQLGWVSGMMNTYPMLALNDQKERQRVAEELDFVVGKLQGKSGYFYGGITANGKLIPEKMNKNFTEPQTMVRKNADALLWLMKHIALFKAQGYQSMIKPQWEEAAKKLAQAFVNTWKEHGQFGQYITPESGKIAVYNSTAGAIAPGGLARASDYFGKPEWMKVAKDAANYYYQRDVVKQGLTGGGCGDISMDSDSESAFGFLQSLMDLYDKTQDKTWLQKAKVEAALCSTWVLSYDEVFPPQSQIGKLNAHMAGAVWASIQNKHSAPGICCSSAEYLFRLARATGDRSYADLINDIQHAHAEAVNIPPGHITTNNLVGSSMERIQPSDAEGKGAIGNFINTRNSWTETNGMLMALELPGIYVMTDKSKLITFDHVNVTLAKKTANAIFIEVENPTSYDANVAVFAESFAQSQKPLPDAAFLHWPKIMVKAGQKVQIMITGDNKVSVR